VFQTPFSSTGPSKYTGFDKNCFQVLRVQSSQKHKKIMCTTSAHLRVGCGVAGKQGLVVFAVVHVQLLALDNSMKNC
jgi:hypothetical protein